MDPFHTSGNPELAPAGLLCVDAAVKTGLAPCLVLKEILPPAEGNIRLSEGKRWQNPACRTPGVLARNLFNVCRLLLVEPVRLPPASQPRVWVHIGHACGGTLKHRTGVSECLVAATTPCLQRDVEPVYDRPLVCLLHLIC